MLQTQEEKIKLDSRKKSLIEVLLDTGMGVLIYLPVNYFVLPIFVNQISNNDVFGFLQISLIFSIIGIIRKYTIRRHFEKLKQRL